MSHQTEDMQPTSPTATNSKAPACEIYTRDQHSLSRRQIDSDALKIMYRLVSHGFKAYLVGGGVRDLLLGKAPKDFDVATDATPRKIKDLFRNSRIIGRRFKLIHVFFRGNKIIEVSTFRDANEVTDSEMPEENENLLITRDNKYGTEETDAIRRDITINALFYDISTFSIIDYVGGMRDLQNKVVRVIGNPEIRFAEDPVRLIRVIRHAARAEFEIDTQCFEAIHKNSALIKNSAPVRVFEEIKKDFSSAYSFPIFRLLEKSGILAHLLPEVSSQAKLLLSEKSDFARVLKESDAMVKNGFPRSPTATFALMTLFLRAAKLDGIEHEFAGADDIEEHVFSCFQQLAVPRKERERIAAVLDAWHRVLTDTKEIRRASELIRSELSDDIRFFFTVLYGAKSALTTYVEEILETRTKDHASESTPPRRRRAPSTRRRATPERKRD